MVKFDNLNQVNHNDEQLNTEETQIYDQAFPLVPKRYQTDKIIKSFFSSKLIRYQRGKCKLNRSNSETMLLNVTTIEKLYKINEFNYSYKPKQSILKVREKKSNKKITFENINDTVIVEADTNTRRSLSYINFPRTSETLDELLNVKREFFVLIIEDEYHAFKSYLRCFKEYNSNSQEINVVCFRAENPIEAINIIYTKLTIENIFFNLIITDDGLPFMQGIKFAELYKERLENIFYKIDIILISGNIMKGYDSFLSNNFLRCYNKPVKKQELFSLIDEFSVNN